MELTTEIHRTDDTTQTTDTPSAGETTEVTSEDDQNTDGTPEFRQVTMQVGQRSYICGQNGTDHLWTILDNDIVSIVSKKDGIAELQASAAGTVYITHDCIVDGKTVMETFEVVVVSEETSDDETQEPTCLLYTSDAADD